MAEFLATIDDGHRHLYDNPPYQKDTDLSYAAGLGLTYFTYKRRPPVERICLRCGFNEKEIQACQRRDKNSVPKVTISNPLNEAYKVAGELNEKDKAGLNNFALIHGKLTYKVKWYWSSACYASLNYDAPKNNVYFIDRAGRPDTKKYPEYQEWCLTSGPYSMAFVNPPSHYAKTKCTIQDCTKMPAQYLVGAAMQFRFLHEYQEIPETWTRLVKYGVDPAIAFIAGTWGSMKENIYTSHAHGALSGHKIFSNQFGSEGLQNFLDHNVQITTYKEEYTGCE